MAATWYASIIPALSSQSPSGAPDILDGICRTDGRCDRQSCVSPLTASCVLQPAFCCAQRAHSQVCLQCHCSKQGAPGLPRSEHLAEQGTMHNRRSWRTSRLAPACSPQDLHLETLGMWCRPGGE